MAISVAGDGRTGAAEGRSRLPRGMFVLVVVAVMVASSAGATLYVAVLMDRGLVLTVGTDKSEYAAGETVIITSELKNHGPGSVTLTFNADPAEVIIVIMDSEGGFVAQYPEIFLWWIKTVELGPGEGIERVFEWDQVDWSGEPVDSPGTFTVCASSPSRECPLSENTTVSIGAASASGSVACGCPVPCHEPVGPVATYAVGTRLFLPAPL